MAITAGTGPATILLLLLLVGESDQSFTAVHRIELSHGADSLQILQSNWLVCCQRIHVSLIERLPQQFLVEREAVESRQLTKLILLLLFFIFCFGGRLFFTRREQVLFTVRAEGKLRLLRRGSHAERLIRAQLAYLHDGMRLITLKQRHLRLLQRADTSDGRIKQFR